MSALWLPWADQQVTGLHPSVCTGLNVYVPSLLIVVDEFAEMLAKYPDFIPGFVSVAQAGRGFKTHLLFATQTMENLGAGWNKLAGNMSYRICLKSGGPGDLHPRAPTERSVTVSRHSALLTAIPLPCASIANV